MRSSTLTLKNEIYTMNEIPKRTAQGMKELDGTHNKDVITNEQRRLLVMIDGKKNLSDILKFEKVFGGAANLDVLRDIGFIEFSSKDNIPSSPSFVGSSLLKERVCEELKSYYGDSIVKDIEKIAHKNPPDHAPIEFLNQCKQKAMVMLNPKQVDKIFLPFYNEFR